MNLGFIGIGNMGLAMATNLQKAGHTLAVYNRTKDRTKPLSDAGATVADLPGSTAKNAPVVFSMLTDDAGIRKIVDGSDGLLAKLGNGAIHVCCSTISPSLSKQLAEQHTVKGQQFVAAPVMGRPDAAAAAKLFILAAGPSHAIETCQPLFDVLGQRTFVVGEEQSKANVVKLSVNFLLAAMIESLAEAFTLTRKSGIEAKAFHSIITESLFTAPVYKSYGGLIANEQFEDNAVKMAIGLKDIGLAMQAAQEAGVPMPVASVVRDQFVSAIARGLGDLDLSGFSKIAAMNAGL